MLTIDFRFTPDECGAVMEAYSLGALDEICDGMKDAIFAAAWFGLGDDDPGRKLQLQSYLERRGVDGNRERWRQLHRETRKKIDRAFEVWYFRCNRIFRAADLSLDEAYGQLALTIQLVNHLTNEGQGRNDGRSFLAPTAALWGSVLGAWVGEKLGCEPDEAYKHFARWADETDATDIAHFGEKSEDKIAEAVKTLGALNPPSKESEN